MTIAVLCPAIAAAQTASVDRAWSYRAAVATYFLPDEADYVQPTFTAERGHLHLETRYNYEALHSVSFFAGRKFSAGSAVEMELTPMFGGLVGDTDGVIPAAILWLKFRRLEFYSESEVVIDLNETSDSFFYSWSEAYVRAPAWLRTGVVIQRTRSIDEESDVQPGIFAGIEIGRIEGAFYFFKPGSADRFFVASIAVSF